MSIYCDDIVNSFFKYRSVHVTILSVSQIMIGGEAGGGGVD